MPATECGDSPALTDVHHRRLADELRAAARDRRGVEPVSARHPELNLADSRRIRDLVLAGRLADGERLLGAVASPGRAGEFRVAWVTDAMLQGDGRVALDDLIDPHVEPRLALRLVRPLSHPMTTVGELVAASRGLLVAPRHGLG